jgi:hypothetical protein
LALARSPEEALGLVEFTEVVAEVNCQAATLLSYQDGGGEI